MKRARPSLPADYDPVYPYDQPSPPTQPPYFNSKKGLTQSPPGTLAVNIRAPLSFGTSGAIGINTGTGLNLKNGALQVNLGPGLSTNAQGQITVQGVGETYVAPLKKDNNEVSLETDSTLTTKNGQLSVVFPPPSPPLSFNAPLTKNNNTVGLQLGTGLSTVNGALQVTFPAAVTYQEPLKNEKNVIKLTLGNGLSVNNGALAVNFKPDLQFDSPLVRANNRVSLNLGNYLTISNNALACNLTFASPLSVNGANNVSLQLGSGLEVKNSALSVIPAPTLTFAAPLEKNQNNVVNFKFGAGFKVENKTLFPNLGPGLQLNNSAIQAKLGQGLQFSGGSTHVKLGAGLQFDGNNAVSLTNQISVTPRVTLWTGPDPSPNALIGGNKVMRCFVALSRHETMVTAVANFKGVGNYSMVHQTQAPFSITFDFNQFGQLMSTGNFQNTTWGSKPINSNLVIPTPNQDWKLCMPNKAIYSQDFPSAFVIGLGLDSYGTQLATNRTIDLLVLLNKSSTPTAEYSITFRFLNFTKLSGGSSFISDNISFNYVGENQ